MLGPLITRKEFEALLHTIRFPGDRDPAETREWLDALATLVREGGADRARRRGPGDRHQGNVGDCPARGPRGVHHRT